MAKVANKQREFLDGVNAETDSEAKILSRKASNWLNDNVTEIKRRVKKAGLKDPIRSYMEPAGLGFATPQHLSTLDNIVFLNQEIQQNAITLVRRSRGYYKNQTIRSINPLFWLETLFYLPKAIVSASGIDASSKLADTALKIVQVLYWLVVITIIILHPELINSLLEKFNK